MKQLKRTENNRSCIFPLRKILLALCIAQVFSFSGIAMNKACAAGGDLLRPATSDTPQPGKQEAKASVVDKAGNLIVTGYQNLAGGADDDYLTVKFNASGTVAWRKSYYNNTGGVNRVGSDQATAIALDSNNNVIVTGFTWNGNNYDIHTIKYSGVNGDKLWEHTYNAPALGNDIATCITVDTLNNVYVGGYVQTSSANEDYVILKYSVNGPNPNGTPVWLATWNGAVNGADKLTAIAAGAGGVAVTGQSWGTATNFDVMTVKYDYNGTKLWEKSYTSSGGYPDGGRKVGIDASGNVIMTASVTNNGNLDIYTAKYPAAGGEPFWGKTYYNPINNDEPAGLIIDAAGNVYVTGYTFTLTGNEDLLVLRYKGTDGTKEWERVYDSGLSNSDFGTDLLLDSAGNILVTGNSVTTDGNHNIITLKIKNDSSNPALYWAAIYDGPADKNEESLGIGLGLGRDGEVIVGGWTDVWTDDASDEDYLMLVYDAGLINPPSLVKATVLTDTDIIIDWADNSVNEDGFKIERKLTELGEWSEIGTVGANITTFTDTYANGLSARNTYYYRVRAYNTANGSSNPSEEIRALTLYVNYQAPNWSYLYNSPDNLDDYSATGIAVGSDNNPVVTGYSMLNANGFDYYTIKLSNSDGSLLWNNRYDDVDGELDKAINITVDSTNAVIVTGYSSLYYPPAASNINSIYTVKYPASCAPPTPCTPTPLWDGQYNGPGAIDDRAVAVAAAVDASNSVVVTGYGKNAAENEDIYLLKYAATPNLDIYGKAIPEWSAMPYNGSFNGDDFPAGVAFDKDGNVFVAGKVQSGRSPVRYKSFVAKYCGKAGALCNGKAPGEIVWQDSFAGSGDNHSRSLAVDKNGNLYAAGFDTGANGTDILLIKYDGKAVPTGSRVLWSRTVDGAAHGDDAAVAVKYDQIDDTVVVGGTVLSATSDHDLIIIRFDSSGNRIESRSKIFLRPGSDEESTDMAMDVSGNVSIAGFTSTGSTADAISVEYDYAGTLLAATIFNGAANSYDEATAVVFNRLGDTLVAGYSTNASGNADYLVYKRTGLALQASSPFIATQYYRKVDLSWTDTSSGETGFYVERKIGACDSGNTWTLIYTAPANATNYSDTGLNVGQEYCYRVRSFKAGEIDPRWIESYSLLDNPVPPSNVVATPTNTTRVDLAWQDNTTGEAGFKIQRCSGAGCTDFGDLNSVGANVVSYTDTVVAAGGTYRYRILAYKTGDPASEWESLYSTPATVTTPSASAPTGLTATRVTEGQIDLFWSDTNNDETGFKIERCETAACTFDQIATVAANVVTFSDTIALKTDTAYRYRVRAYKSAIFAWDGPYNSTSAEATTTLDAATGLTASPANTTTINLSWIDNTSTETGFKIERCHGSNCVDFAEVGQTISSATTWSDTGVCNGSTYTYRVSAINTGLSMSGAGAWTRRKPLTITNFQPNFQTKVTVSYDADMKANFDDIRFYDETSKREIPYFIESKTDSSTATVWIKTGANNVISLYYGNASALSANNGPVVYEFFDNFAGKTIDVAKWTTVNGSYYSQNDGLISSGGAGDWNSGIYSVTSFDRPFVFETDLLRTGGNYVMIGAKNTGTGINYTDFTYAAYAAYDGGGSRLLVYEDGNWRGDNLKAISSDVWQNYKFEVLATGANYYQGLSPSAYTNFYASTYSSASPLKVGFTNVNEVFKLRNARIRKYAATETAVSLGATEPSAAYAFVNTWTGLPATAESAPTPTPVAPTSPAATRVSEARIDLAWTDTTSDESGFRIERCKGAACADFAQIGTVGAGVIVYSDTTPMDINSTYRYQVRAYKTATCSGGWDGPASAIVAKESTLVEPSGLTAVKSVSTTCDDLRITDSDGATLLDYFVDSGCGTAFTKVWLKISTLATGTRPLYLYWANPTAAAAMSSPSAIFDFYEDFSGTEIDTSKWTVTDGTGFTVANGFLHGTNTSGRLTSKTTFTPGVVLDVKAKTTAMAPNGQMIGGFYLSAATNIGWLNHPGDAHYRNNYGWVAKGSSETPANNMLYTITAKNSTTANLQMYNLDTAAMFWNVGDVTNNVANEPIVLGTRFDDILPGQAYATDWDWIRVRKYAPALPTLTFGSIATGTYILAGGTWNVRRPFTVTNGGTELTSYQQELTVDTTAVASDRVSLAWTDNTGSETGFIVERCTGTDCNFTTNYTFSAAANATSFVDKSVALATTYCYRVKADKATVPIWTSAPSNSACATTTTIALPVLAITTTTSNALSWDDSTTGEDGFSIERCLGSGCDFSTLDSGFPVTVLPNVTSYADTSVCAPLYRYRVRSFKYGPSGWNNYSNIVDAATLSPTPPSGLDAARISELQINLAWTDNTTDETGFKIDRCTGTGCSNFAQIADLPFNTATYSDAGRLPNTVYRYRVHAHKSGGCGWGTTYSAAAEGTTLVAAPSGLTAAAPVSTQVALVWSDNTVTETAFKLERCLTSNCTYAPLVTVGANLTNYSDDSVCASTDYTYRLKAVNEGSTNSGGGTWTQRKPLAITNFQPDFLVNVTIAHDVFMQPDFADIRFVDTVNGIELPYWIESKTDSSTASVWFKTATSNSVYLYFGNSSATSSSSAALMSGPGIMAYYPFNEATGTIGGSTADANGTGNDLTLTNFTTGYGIVAGGKYGNGLSLNGTDNYAKLANPAVPAGSVASIEAWIYPTAYTSDPTYNGIVSWGARSSMDSLALSIQNSGRLSMPSWGNDFVPTTGVTSTLSAWNHVAAVLNGTSFTLYTNGQLVGTTTLAQPTMSSVNLAIGALDFTGGRHFSGIIDEVRIYNRVLGAQEIATHYAAPSAVLGAGETIITADTYAFTYSSDYNTPPFAVTTPALAVPTAFSATMVDESRLRLTWTDGVTGETAFEIDRCEGAGCDFTTRTTFEVAANRSSYTDVGLNFDTTYRYQIRAKRASTCTAYSSYATAVQAVTTLTAPGNLTITAPNTTQLNLSWTDITGSDTGFKVERCTGNGCTTGFSLIGNSGKNVSSYPDTTVCPGTTYGYRVAAVNVGLSSGGEGCWTGRKPITITNFQPDFQTKVTIDHVGTMKADFSDIRFYDPVSHQELPYWFESKINSTSATLWVKTQVSSTIYLYYGNGLATSVDSGDATFEFYDYFNGTTIDTAKWVKADDGAYLNQNGELIVSGGSGGWGSNSMYSVASIARPFILELKHKQTAGASMMFGVKDSSANAASYSYYPYAVFPSDGSYMYVFESGNQRGGGMTLIAPNVWEYYKFEVLGAGAKYYVGTAPTAYNLFYDSTFSSDSPLKIGFVNVNQAFRMDDVRARKFASPEPVTAVGAGETSTCFTFTGIYTSGYSSIEYQTTRTPVAPTTLTVTATSDTNMHLSWADNSNDETVFRIDRCAGANCSSFSEIATVAANTVNINDTVEPSTDYCYRVRADKTAVCSNGWPSGYSNIVCDKAFSSRTDSFVATAVGPFTIRLDWHDLAIDEDGYLLQIQAWNGKWVNVATTLPGVTTYLDTVALEPLKTYIYRVRPYRGSDNSPFVTSNPVTTPPFTQGAGTCP